MKVTTETYNLPTYWACALINGDYEGLTLDEEQDLNTFLKEENPGYCVEVSEESYFGRYNGLGCDMSTYTFITN